MIALVNDTQGLPCREEGGGELAGSQFTLLETLRGKGRRYFLCEALRVGVPEELGSGNLEGSLSLWQGLWSVRLILRIAMDFSSLSTCGQVWADKLCLRTRL